MTHNDIKRFADELNKIKKDELEIITIGSLQNYRQRHTHESQQCLVKAFLKKNPKAVAVMISCPCKQCSPHSIMSPTLT